MEVRQETAAIPWEPVKRVFSRLGAISKQIALSDRVICFLLFRISHNGNKLFRSKGECIFYYDQKIERNRYRSNYENMA